MCLAALSLGTQSLAGTAALSWETLLVQGKEFLRQKNYGQARQCFEQVTRLQPRFGEGFFYLGVSALQTGDRPTAETALRKAVKLSPNAVSALYNLGVLLLDLQKPAEAAGYLEKARQVDPHNQELTANLIRADLESGQEKRALNLLDSADRQFASEVGFHVVVGKLLFDHGLNAPSCAELSAANRLMPGQTEIALPLADACLAAHEAATVKSALMSVREQSQGNARFHSLAAQAALQSGDLEAALDEIKAAVQLEPSNPLFLLQLGRLHQKRGEQAEALAVLERARTLDPQNAEVLYSMAVSYAVLENERKAIEVLNRALEIAPSFDRALFLLGSIHLSMDRLDEADKPLTEALRLQPENPFYLCFAGMLRIQQLRPEEAQREFRQAEVISPSYALPHFHMGRLFARTGKYPEAEQELKKSISLQPNLSEAYYELGLLLHKLGKQDEAEQAMARFQSLRGAEKSGSEIVMRELQDAVR